MFLVEPVSVVLSLTKKLGLNCCTFGYLSVLMHVWLVLMIEMCFRLEPRWHWEAVPQLSLFLSVSKLVQHALGWTCTVQTCFICRSPIARRCYFACGMVDYHIGHLTGLYISMLIQCISLFTDSETWRCAPESMFLWLKKHILKVADKKDVNIKARGSVVLIYTYTRCIWDVDLLGLYKQPQFHESCDIKNKPNALIDHKSHRLQIHSVSEQSSTIFV